MSCQPVPSFGPRRSLKAVRGFCRVAVLGVLAAWAAAARAEELPKEQAAEIDEIVAEVLEQTLTPGASIAVVRGGDLAHAKAYGWARLSPEKVAATAETRFPIGSVSKQFIAAAVLLLAEDGKLSLDDPVEKFVPGLTEGTKITVRQTLNHTSGYRDYWPQDYVFPAMREAATPDRILAQWARVPLDFQPGEEWQYSNTGYTVAGQVIEKASGKPVMDFLRERIFEPLKMTKADEHDTKPLAPPDAAGHLRIAMGPLRSAPKEGAGWLYAAGPLAMPASDLALWNISLIKRSLLKPESYDEMTTPVNVASGDARYGLGIGVRTDDAGRRMLAHGGAVSGFLTENRVWPEEQIAISVLVNSEGAGAHRAIADRIRDVLFPPTGSDAEAREIFSALQQGKIDAAKFSPNGQSYFSAEALADAATGLQGLGKVRLFVRQATEERGGMTYRSYRATCAKGTADVAVRVLPDGKYEQYMVSPSLR